MKKDLLKIIIILFPVSAWGISVEGKHYPARVNVEGKQLKLIGAGLREKWVFDVYTLGAYSESGKCIPQQIINANEAKYLRIDMLRDVSAKKMASTIGEAFDEHMPKNASAELKTQKEKFLSYFTKECQENMVLEFIYLPETGTMMKQQGKLVGTPLKGPGFMKLLWNIYFGKKSCCEDLKEEILGSCKKNK